MREGTVHFESIDDHLGAGRMRFFGDGYRRIRQRLGRIKVAADMSAATGFAESTASIDYPGDWSTKSRASDLRPHLSTVDAAVLSVQLCEAYLSQVYAMGPAQRRLMWLRRMELKASSTPLEQLDRIDLRAVCTETRRLPDGALSLFTCHLGSMRVKCEIVHPGQEPPVAAGLADLPEGYLGDPEERFFGAGYRRRGHVIRDVQLDLGLMRCAAHITCESEGPLPTGGFAGAFEPSLSAVDAMVVVPQLSQSLLYKLDGIDRGESNTLWMRRVTIETDTPRVPLTARLDAVTTITATRLLNHAGGVWRTSDWAGTFQGFRYRYNLAHQLPAGRGEDLT
ncbi:AvrD family protein [Streptomyces venetus]|uniref:AvrD family protein n=1 Tax=Streptomyces venetus TaxID=1701086 RepID=UPI003C2D4B5A